MITKRDWNVTVLSLSYDICACTDYNDIMVLIYLLIIFQLGLL